jgi:hypothetical protein
LIRTLPCLALALALAACGESESEAPEAAAEVTPATAPAPAEGAVDAPGAMDSAAPAPALDDDDLLEAENRASYERRRRSMASYEDCIRQARGLPAETRARIEEACEARREAP